MLCYGESTGTSFVTVNGGLPPYSEDWGSVNPSALIAGSYSVIVSDFAGCSSTEFYTINETSYI